MKIIERIEYLDQLINTIDTPDIKVITGVRRSGKSFLLENFIDYIKKEIKNVNIIYINYNDGEFNDIKESDLLLKYIKSKYDKEKNNFILIDEVQLCTNFEDAIISLHNKKKYNIYITGSNAFLLSSDLATLFTGRTFSIEILPFSFKEYLKYFELNDKYKAFDAYIKDGGFAGTYLYKDEAQKYDYLKELFKVLILRDIVQKYKIRQIPLFKNLTDYMIDNISNITSANNIADYLKQNVGNIDHKTIDKYLEYLSNAFAFYNIKRYDIKGKKYLKTNNKYYLCDHAIRYATLGTKNLDRGRILENIIAIELLRRKYEVYVGSLYNKEIDFVAIDRNEKLYIQVADNIDNKMTLDREITPLLSIKDGYKKILIANTKQEKYSIEGIDIYDFSEWLTK